MIFAVVTCEATFQSSCKESPENMYILLNGGGVGVWGVGPVVDGVDNTLRFISKVSFRGLHFNKIEGPFQPLPCFCFHLETIN